MGHVLALEKGNFLIRGAEATRPHASHAGLILSIPAKQVSLGSPRVGIIHVQAPTPHAPPLQAFLVDFSQQPTELLGNGFQSSPSALEANLGQNLLFLCGLLREIGQKCLKRRRMRCRRLHVYSTDPRRPQGDLFGRD